MDAIDEERDHDTQSKTDGQGAKEQKPLREARQDVSLPPTDEQTGTYIRQDTSLPWDKEWLKKSRDDAPPSDRPMPENPLHDPSVSLKPQDSTGSSSHVTDPPAREGN